MADPELGEERPRPRPIDYKSDWDKLAPANRQFWFLFGIFSWALSVFFFACKFMKVPGQKPIHDDSLVPGPIEGYTVVSGALYLCLLMRVYIPREPLPRVVLRLSHKQLLESAFVVCLSCWGYYTMDKYDYVAALGLVICMSVVPIINLWLHFDNISYLDFSLIVAVKAAVFRFRRDGVLILIRVSVGGVALQLIKNAFWHFRSRIIKNSSEKHLI